MTRKLKDPSAILDYSCDWGTKWMATGDAIATSTWTVPVGLVNEAESATDTVATVWLSGGTAGASYEIVNRIVTEDGRTDERTLTIVVVDR